MATSYVYIVTNKPHGTLYVGITSNLVQRIYQHKQGTIDSFTKKYKLTKLVYYEIHVFQHRSRLLAAKAARPGRRKN